MLTQACDDDRRRFPADAVRHPFDSAATRDLEAVAGFDRLCAATIAAGQHRFVPGRAADDSTDMPYDELARWIASLLPPVETAFGVEPLRVRIVDGGRPMLALPASSGSNLVVVPRELAARLAADRATDELVAALARECAHLVLHDARLRIAAICVTSTVDASSMIRSGAVDSEFVRLVESTVTPPLRRGLADWVRAGDLSADRAAAVYLGDADAVTRLVFRSADPMDRCGRGPADDPADDPDEDLAVARRVREVQAWTATAGFDALVRAGRNITARHVSAGQR